MLETKYNTKSNNDYKVITNLDYRMVAFTPNRIGKWNSFVFDTELQKYYTFDKNARNYSILDISPNGRYVMIGAHLQANKTNELKIIDLETKDTIVTIKDYFFYEAYFTNTLRFILCRAKIFSNVKTFVYDIVNKDILLDIKIDDFVLNGSFEKTRERYAYVKKGDDNIILTIDFKTMTQKIIDLKYDDSIIRKVYFTDKNIYYIKDIYGNMILYSNGKIESIVKTYDYLPKYTGDIIIADDYKTLYYDTPVHLYDTNNLITETILYKIDYHKGLLVKAIKLSTSNSYTKFYPLSSTSIIDSNCSILNIKTFETSKFDIDRYK